MPSETAYIAVPLGSTTTAVAVVGEVTFANVLDFDHALGHALDEGAQNLVVDLTDVTFIDSSGLSSLLTASARARDGGGTVHAARIALGCMADRPVRARAAEAALVGSRLDASGVEAAVEAVSEGIAPPTDPIASEWYRREVLPVHFRRLLLG